MKDILKVLVGSREHGLERQNSDYDWRGVFMLPTSEVLLTTNLKIGKIKNTQFILGDQDNTSHELGHFLQLAMKSNPSVLEVLCSTTIDESGTTEEGMIVKDLFDDLWSSEGVYNSFKGYAHNQLKKFIDNKDDNMYKFAVAYLRTLTMGIELLVTGRMNMKIEDETWLDLLKQVRDGEWTPGQVLDYGADLKRWLGEAYNKNKNKKTNVKKIQEVYLDLRYNNWE